jgi:spore germination protein YaaH
MGKYLFWLLCFPFVAFAQLSTVQEQRSYYERFRFNNELQWDSLNFHESGHKYQVKNNSDKATVNCNLNKKVYGWHPYWVGSVYTNYDWSLISDFCYFDYSVSPSTGNNTNASFAWATSAAVTAALSNSVDVHFCATMFANHSTFWASSTAQQTFITNAINLLNSRGGNGLNIDFEGMGSGDNVPFTNFMTNLCNQVHAANANYKVTLALYAVDWGTSFDITALNTIVDQFIIMGYDYYYSGSTTAGPEAPLYNFETTYNQTLSKSITYYLKQGASKNKLLLGLPWYGREWETISNNAPASTTGGFTASRLYNYVRNNSGTYSAVNKHWDNNSFNPYYTYQSAGNWRQCWIDDNYSYGRKFDMVNQRGIGGIGIWALGYDDGYNDLWNLIKDKFTSCGNVACSDSIFDMGGPGRNYYNSESYSYTIAPTGANKVRLDFTQMDLEQGFDSLYIYDGQSANSPVLGAFTGTTLPAALTSSGPVIMVKFKSDNATIKGGYKAIWSCLSDNINPTTQITTPPGWITNDFSVSYTDVDNINGSGIDNSFYQVCYYNGIEWRSNNGNGFFNDDFNITSIHNDWTNSVGTWSISAGELTQTDEANSNTNIYSLVTQSLSAQYLYQFKASISGSGVNKRAGIYIMADNPTQTQRGNSYMIWLRPDQSSIEFYKSTANTIGLPTYSLSCTINAGITYDYKILYDRISGEIKIWQNDIFVGSWADLNSPHTNGNSVSFRTGNSVFKIDEFKVFRSRSSSNVILVGSTSLKDIRKENVSPILPAGIIRSITKDNANNLSFIAEKTVNIDWTKPTSNSIINDGTLTDIDTTYIGSSLDLNYTAAKDTNSGIANYYYAIGSFAGGKDIVPWTSNSLNLSASNSGLILSDHQKYFVMVKAINNAGLMSDSIVSDGVLFLMPTALSNESFLNTLSVFPNPTSEKLTITLIGKEEERINCNLMDAIGKQIESHELNVLPGVNSFVINLNRLRLSKGIYFIKFTSLGKEFTKKIVIE